MPIIAPQHKWKDADFSPSCDWPDDTTVQWGSKGLVLGKNPYQTAFFEAFPSDQSKTGGFIRGEGKTISDAEKNAFQKFLTQADCNHLWGRGKYRNGGQICRRCKAFRSGILKPVVNLGDWREPIPRASLFLLELEDEEPTEAGKKGLLPGSRSYLRRIYLRKKFFGVES